MWRLSTGLRNALLEYDAKVKTAISDTDISFSSGTGNDGRDEIKSSSSAMTNFHKNDIVSVVGSANNDGHYRVLSATPTTLEVASGSLIDESAGAKVILAVPVGGSYAGVLRNGTIKIFTGNQPASADDGETGVMICEITLNSGAFTPGSPTNGINLGQVANGIIKKAIDADTGNPEVWSGIGNSSAGPSGMTAGWFRFYSNTVDTGSSTDAIRIDGAIATSGAQLNMSNTTIVEGVTVTIDSVNLVLPESP